MGLLNAMDSPEMGLAMGLLSAGGPSRMPISLGQGLAQGYQGYQQAQQAQQAEELRKLQLKHLQMQMDAEAQMKPLQIREALAKQAMNEALMRRFGVGGGQQAQAGLSPSAPGLSQSSAAMFGRPELATPEDNQLNPANPSRPLDAFSKIPAEAALLELVNNGGKELGKWAYESNKPNMQMHNGVAFDMNQVRPGFQPGITTSQNGQTAMTIIGPDGFPRIVAPQGAPELYQAYRRADEAAKAGFDVQTVTPPSGRPVMTTRGNIVNQIGRTDPTFPRVSATEQAARDDDRRSIIKSELKTNPNDPFLQKEAQGMGIPLQSEEEKARTAAVVDVDKQRAIEQQKKGQGQQNLLVPLEEIRNRLANPEMVLGNDPASRAKMLGHNYGMQTRATINTQRIRELANQLTLANGSLGAGVSNADRETYERAYGQFAEAKSHADMLDAVDTMTRIAQKYIGMDTNTRGALGSGNATAGATRRYNPATGRIE